MELRLDGYGDAKVLNNAEYLVHFQRSLIAKAGMRIVWGPNIHSYKEPGLPDAGLTAFTLIAESHCVLHGWPERDGYFEFTLSSCKTFDVNKIEDYVQMALGMRSSVRREVDPERGGPHVLAMPPL